MLPPKAPAIAMGLKPAVDLKIMPVRVAAPTELNSSSSPPRILLIKVSRLQYINAVSIKTTHDQFVFCFFAITAKSLFNGIIDLRAYMEH